MKFWNFVPTILGILYKALKTARKIDEIVFRYGFRIIGISQLLIFAVFIIDTLASVFIENLELYGILLNLTWIFPLIIVLLYYLGWIMPEWFKKIFIK